MSPSFTHSWEYRSRRTSDRWFRFIGWMVIFLLGATLLNSLVPVSNASEKETYIDDAYICSHIHEYPIEQHKPILDYCIDLHERGL